MKKLWQTIRAYLHSTDRWLLLMWLGASLASMLFLFGIYNSGLLPSTGRLIMQACSISMGLCAAVIISLFDYNSLFKLWKLYVPICAALVLLTFFVGYTRGSDQAWLIFSVAGRQFSAQPSEILKISFITTFAMHLDRVKDNINSIPNMLMLCLHGGVHVLLIQMQGDSGSALIFGSIFLIMLFYAGISWKYIVTAAAGLVAAIPVIWTKIMTADQKMRILIIMNPERDADYAWQQMRGAIALGTGGIQGTGIFSGRHVPVPEVSNDFIFAFIGESSGFIGCLGVILLLAAISFKILYNTRLAKDYVGKFVCIGMFGMIVSQIFVNLGMCLSLLPVIGVTLPLFSAGGTSVLSLYLGLGLILSVYRHSSTALFYEK